MPSDRHDTVLRAMYSRSESDSERVRREKHCHTLEHQLLSQFASRPAPREHSRFWGFVFGARRFAVASVVFAALAIGACQMPVEMNLVMGQQMRFVLPATDDMHDQVRQITREIEEIAPVEKIEVQIQRSNTDEHMVVQLGVWGEGLDPEVVFDHLRTKLPILEEAECDAQPLQGTVRTTLGDRLGHDLFHLALDERNVEDARAAILREIEASGFDGDAQVTVEEGGGHRRIQIKLHQQQELEGSPSGVAIEEEIEEEVEIQK